MLDCIYCKIKSFEKDKGSKEHAILSSLGGRKISRNICCEDCNNRLGSEIDTAFNDLSFISTMLGIETGRNKDAPLQKDFIKHEGESYNLNPGGKFQLSKPSVEFKNKGVPGKEEFSINAANKEQALKLLGEV